MGSLIRTAFRIAGWFQRGQSADGGPTSVLHHAAVGRAKCRRCCKVLGSAKGNSRPPRNLENRNCLAEQGLTALFQNTIKFGTSTAIGFARRGGRRWPATANFGKPENAVSDSSLLTAFFLFRVSSSRPRLPPVSAAKERLCLKQRPVQVASGT